MPINCDKIEDFLELITNNKIHIYGTGYVANLFWNELEKKGLTQNVEDFIVSEVKESEYTHSIPIKGIENVKIDKGSIVCIAVHETLKDEIEMNLLKKQIRNFLWIYPFLYEFSLGCIQKEECWVDIHLFHNVMKEQYGIALRYAAIEEYYGFRKNGFDMYYRGLLTYNSTRTAELRVKRFKDLIINWEKNGYQQENTICVNRVHEVIDGEHRLALAFYHGIKKIKCIVYEGENIHNQQAIMTHDILQKGGFCRKELEQLDGINQTILRELEEK